MYWNCDLDDNVVMDQEQQNERTSAFEWLMEDPEHRAIESPTGLDAVLNLYAARDQYPDATLTRDQFTWPRLPAEVGRDSRVLPLHLYTL